MGGSSSKHGVEPGRTLVTQDVAARRLWTISEACAEGDAASIIVSGGASRSLHDRDGSGSGLSDAAKPSPIGSSSSAVMTTTNPASAAANATDVDPSSAVPVTLFVHSINPRDPPAIKAAVQNHLHKLKILRHPSIIKFVQSETTDDEIRLVTEPVVPLAQVLATLSVDEIVVGLYRVLKALIFLHDQCSMAHNNLSESAIFVSSMDGGWRLGSLEFAVPFPSATKAYLDSTRPFRAKRSVPPEETQPNFEAPLSIHVPYATDSYGFATLVAEVLSVTSSSDHGDSLSPSAAQMVEDCAAEFTVADDCRKPLSVAEEFSFFRENNLLVMLRVLTNLAVEPHETKLEFFETLHLRAAQLDEGIFLRLILPHLVSRRTLMDPCVLSCLPHLLTPRKPDFREEVAVVVNGKQLTVSPLIDEPTFVAKILPRITPLFALREVEIWGMLMAHLHLFAHLMDVTSLQQVVLPPMVAALSDSSDNVVSSTLSALVHLVPLLKGQSVIPALGPRSAIFRQRVSRPSDGQTKPQGHLFFASLPSVKAARESRESQRANRPPAAASVAGWDDFESVAFDDDDSTNQAASTQVPAQPTQVDLEMEEQRAAQLEIERVKRKERMAEKQAQMKLRAESRRKARESGHHPASLDEAEPASAPLNGHRVENGSSVIVSPTIDLSHTAGDAQSDDEVYEDMDSAPVSSVGLSPSPGASEMTSSKTPSRQLSATPQASPVPVASPSGGMRLGRSSAEPPRSAVPAEGVPTNPPGASVAHSHGNKLATHNGLDGSAPATGTPSKPEPAKKEFDFFADMEPVYTAPVLVNATAKALLGSGTSSFVSQSVPTSSTSVPFSGSFLEMQTNQNPASSVNDAAVLQTSFAVPSPSTAAVASSDHGSEQWSSSSISVQSREDDFVASPSPTLISAGSSLLVAAQDDADASEDGWGWE
ncbi:hypothetical protein CAOG_08871 [Capsaspora owczarzaki ATCC 30864]|uniref:SCY1 protein kinase n=1 Tax=Capsaspora owczarzaki (strain ATCC 30864) TaxID=595528 RepID=A0A0D2WRQ1_CAPO3|nr:hypothetical protein CAOG_08871 [Capsaspora owczarzaki ATCC 30864]KJE94615.1 SCY1 protein kinase [Capsaspora owczarzaki ATCC 30864]|eukprot:XP_011270526.1 hypothetical protein CAOG_08871 [Capsaspora owczarzaki ATCC 30864]